MGEMGNKPPNSSAGTSVPYLGYMLITKRGFSSAQEHLRPHFREVQALNFQRTRQKGNCPNKYSLPYSLWVMSARNRVWLRAPDTRRCRHQRSPRQVPLAKAEPQQFTSGKLKHFI